MVCRNVEVTNHEEDLSAESVVQGSDVCLESVVLGSDVESIQYGELLSRQAFLGYWSQR